MLERMYKSVNRLRWCALLAGRQAVASLVLSAGSALLPALAFLLAPTAATLDRGRQRLGNDSASRHPARHWLQVESATLAGGEHGRRRSHIAQPAAEPLGLAAGCQVSKVAGDLEVKALQLPLAQHAGHGAPQPAVAAEAQHDDGGAQLAPYPGHHLVLRHAVASRRGDPGVEQPAPRGGDEER